MFGLKPLGVVLPLVVAIYGRGLKDNGDFADWGMNTYDELLFMNWE